MSATTGIPSRPVWGDASAVPRSDRLARDRTKPVTKQTPDNGPPDWLVNVGQLFLATVMAILSIPLLIVGAIVALVAAAWSILLPALVAGFVIVVVSIVIGGL